MPELSLTNEFSLSEMDGVIREVLDSGGEFELYPRGTSMLPLLHQGRDAVTLIKPCGRLREDDIAFYQRKDGHYVLHRVISVQENGYTMCGDNQITPEPGITEKQIIAVVGSMKIDGTKISMTDKKYLRYVKRRKNLKLRHIMLAVYHRNPFRGK